MLRSLSLALSIVIARRCRIESSGQPAAPLTQNPAGASGRIEQVPDAVKGYHPRKQHEPVGGGEQLRRLMAMRECCMELGHSAAIVWAIGRLH